MKILPRTPPVWLGVALVCGLLGGCGSAPPPADLSTRLQDEDPAVRAAAILQADKERNQTVLPYLVDRLSDSESDVRWLAYMALKDITGKTMGYSPYVSSSEWGKAQDCWRQWLAGGRKDAPSSGPASAPCSMPTTSTSPSAASDTHSGGNGRS